MPIHTLGNHSSTISKVVNALERCAGMPQSQPPHDSDYLKTLCIILNGRYGLDLEYAGESFDYRFKCNTKKSADFIVGLQSQIR